MTTNRIIMAGLALACIAVLALGWFLGVKPQLDAASASDASTAQVQQENLTHDSELTELKKQYGDVTALKAKLATLKQSVPSSVDAAGLIGSISATAQLAGVKVDTITVGDPLPYAPATASAPTGTAATAAPGSSASPSPSASATAPSTTGSTATAPNSSAGIVAVSAADSAAVSGGNFYTVPVTISIHAGYAESLVFISSMQSSTRLFLVTQANLSGADAVSGSSGTITGLIYVLVDPNAPAGGGSSTSPTATPTPTPTPTKTPTQTPVPTGTATLTPTPTATTKP